MILLNIENLSIGFNSADGFLPVIEDLEFSIAQGETVALVGESGSGKSLTALSLLGLLPATARITHGSIKFQDQDLTALPQKQWRAIRGRDIALVPQDPNAALNPVLTVGTQVVEAIRAHQALSRRQALAFAIELLDQVGLQNPSARLRDYPHQLSGGMRQRVVIAMAVANRPRLVIADEATTALDVTLQSQIVELMQGLCQHYGSSLLWISHDLALVSHIAQRILVMYAGRIVEAGLTENILRRPHHPYTEALLRAHPAFAVRRQTLTALSGQPPLPTPELQSGCVFRSRCPRRQEQCETPPPRREYPGQSWAYCWFPVHSDDCTEAK